MSNQFDWQTEGDDWEEPAPPPQNERTLGRRLGLLLIFLLALLGAGAIAYREVSVRLHETTARLEREVRASHRLVQEAISSGDTELLKSFMSGRDSNWTDSQLALADQGDPRGYKNFGLHRVGSVAAEAAPEITLSNELDIAEVVAPVAYVVTPTNGISTTITLASTMVYRQGEDRWLWSPPEESFWGSRHAMDLRPGLRLTYPERDAEIVLQLVDHIESRLDRLCEMLGPDCPGDLVLTLAFETDPATLLMTLDDRQRWLDRGELILLPAPSLLGEPVDGRSFEALADLYSAAVAEPIIAEVGDYHCCQNELFAQAILDWQLNMLGLRQWPLQPDDYTQISDRFPGLEWPGTLWNRPAEQMMPESDELVYALIEFVLVQEGAQTVPHLLRGLSGPGYSDWLGAALPAEEAITPDFRWRAFLTRRANEALPPLPLPLPDQEVAALCPIGSQQHTLYRINPANGRWTSAGAPLGRNIEFIVPLAGGQALIAHSNQAAGPPQLSLYDGDSLRHRGTLSEAPAGFYTIMGIDPTGTKALLLVQPQDSDRLQYYLLDGGQCDQGGCDLQRLQGHVIWSPEGDSTLVMRAQDGQVWPFVNDRRWPQMIVSLGNENGVVGRTLAADALYGLWLDNTTYVLLKSEGDGHVGDAHLVIANYRTRQVLASVPVMEVVGRLPLNPPVDPSQLMVHLVDANQAGNQELLIMVFNPTTPYANVMLYDWRQGVAQPLGLENLAWPPSFSPDGRWLLAHEYQSEGQSGRQFQVILIDLLSGTRRNYPGRSFSVGPSLGLALNWSADGRWLLHGGGHSLFILSPEHEYRLPLLLGGGECSHAFWLKP